MGREAGGATPTISASSAPPAPHEWCTVTTEDVFTTARLEAWNHHTASPARVIPLLPDSRLRVEIDDEFADYDSLDASCQDSTWLITKPERRAGGRKMLSCLETDEGFGS